MRVSRAAPRVQGLYKGQPSANDTLRRSPRGPRNEREAVEKKKRLGTERTGEDGKDRLKVSLYAQGHKFTERRRIRTGE